MRDDTFFIESSDKISNLLSLLLKPKGGKAVLQKKEDWQVVLWQKRRCYDKIRTKRILLWQKNDGQVCVMTKKWRTGLCYDKKDGQCGVMMKRMSMLVIWPKKDRHDKKKIGRLILKKRQTCQRYDKKKTGRAVLWQKSTDRVVLGQKKYGLVGVLT